MITLMDYKPNTKTIDLFDSIFNMKGIDWNKPTNTEMIKYDVIENDEKYDLDLMLPGFKKENINILVEEDSLIIKGERKENENKKFNRKGSFFGDFEKSFYLPDNILEDKISASFNDGILTITIPKDDKGELSKIIEIK